MIQWGVVAAFIVPLITAMTLIAGAVSWFVRIQIRLVTSAMEARLQIVEKGLADMQKTVSDTALTLARVEGKLTGSYQTPPTQQM